MKKILVLAVAIPAAAVAKMVVVDEASVPQIDKVTLAISAPKDAVKIGASLGQIEAPPRKEVWTGEPGMMLSEMMIGWAKKKGDDWHLEWDTDTDFNLKAPLRFEGSIDQAAADAIRLYEKSKNPLRVEISLEQKYIYVTDRKAK